MAEVLANRTSVTVNTAIKLLLTEEEARALEAIFGYNVDIFLKVFYEKMGRHYVEPHEAGVRSLHKTIRSILAGPLQEVSDIRQKVVAALAKPIQP